MANSLYISASEAESGKSLISLGIIEILIRRYKRVGYFRPFISTKREKQKEKLIKKITNYLSTQSNVNISYEDTYVMSKSEGIELINNGEYTRLLERVISKFKELEDRCDFILCEGTSYNEATAAFELDINADFAKNLGTPILSIVSGHNRNMNQIKTSIKMAEAFYKKKGRSILGTIVNRTNTELVEPILKKFTEKMNAKGCFFSVIPDDSLIRNKSALVLNRFKQHVDFKSLEEYIISSKTSGTTYKMFEYELLKQAKISKQHIVLPEGEDDRTLLAAEILKQRDIVDISILGDKKQIESRIERLNVNLEGIPIIEPIKSPDLDKYAKALFELRKEKGMTENQARDILADVSYFGTMMVQMGDVDGMVSGAAHTTGETIKPALQIIKTKPGCSVVSSVFFMCLEGRISVFGDCAVNPNPTAEQLAEIAISSADTAQAFDIEPRVALLSYSSGSSGQGPDVEKVAKAAMIAKKARPDLKIEGPIQYDAAVDIKVGQKKLPGSEVAGRASVMVFPDLNTGNNTYKAVQRESGAEAIGPMLQGLNKPVNDLSRGCSILDIVNTVIITAIQAQGIKKTTAHT